MSTVSSNNKHHKNRQGSLNSVSSPTNESRQRQSKRDEVSSWFNIRRSLTHVLGHS